MKRNRKPDAAMSNTDKDPRGFEALSPADALRLGIKWMDWWLSHSECECHFTGHTCGLRERQGELEQMRKTLHAMEALEASSDRDYHSKETSIPMVEFIAGLERAKYLAGSIQSINYASRLKDLQALLSKLFDVAVDKHEQRMAAPSPLENRSGTEQLLWLVRRIAAYSRKAAKANGYHNREDQLDMIVQHVDAWMDAVGAPRSRGGSNEEE